MCNQSHIRSITASCCWLLSVVLFSACQKRDTPVSPPITSISITSISPTSGSYGDEALIYGSFTDTTVSHYLVLFGGVKGKISYVGSNRISVQVPKGAKSGAVSVSINGVAVSSGVALNFAYFPSGTVTTIAGTGVWGATDGPANTAQFGNNAALACDNQGNLYICDVQDSRIRKLSSNGMVSTVAGSSPFDPQYPTGGYMDGTGASALFKDPRGIIVDATGNLYIADAGNNRIRKITPDNTVSTLAGNGISGYKDGDAQTAEFYNPYGIVLDQRGNLFVGDQKNSRIRKITASGVVSTFSGSGVAGNTDGFANSAQINVQNAPMCTDANGNIYFAQWVSDAISQTASYVIRKVTPAGDVSTYHQQIPIVYDFNGKQISGGVWGIAIDAQNNIYVANDYSISRITPGGAVSIIAGSTSGSDFQTKDGFGREASFKGLNGLCIDGSGVLYASDYGYIRKIVME